ncbi:MAG: phosphoenolpyruvate--protein phosphotransferase [bacterium]|nr:phosphoenolpyruvate--protein phosphotransferase [bacterium]
MADGVFLWRPVNLMLRSAAPQGERTLKGIPASAGIAIGRAFVLSIDSPSVSHERIEPASIPHEVTRFKSALESVAGELVHAIDLARQESTNVSTIIESFLLIVGDPVISGNIVGRIETGTPAETAVMQEFDHHQNMLYNARDSFLRDRAQDFDHVKERLVAILRNQTLSHAAARNSIVVSGSITPQDMLFFKQTRALGFITEIGGINSHACIMARDMGIPAVIGIRNATSDIVNNITIIVDGYAGVVIVDPSDATLREYTAKQEQAEDYRRRLGKLIQEPAVTIDGATVCLMANVDTPKQVDAAVMVGADGFGLVRTEYMLVERGRYPSHEEQVEWYTDIADRAFPKTVTFRAFDVGSDKFREGIPHHEDNPALGLRGIRFLLYRPDIFEQQACAVLKASVHRNVRFMLPMVCVIEEFEQAKHLIQHCMQKLDADGFEYDASMPVGVMIETPAAALLADVFAKAADFLSIGTNDLAQYTLATDRTNELVADIFDALHPSVLKLIRMTVDAARTYEKPVSLCGELAGHAAATELLIGFGLTELSVSTSVLLELKQRIRSVSKEDCLEVVRKALACTTTSEVYAVLAHGR